MDVALALVVVAVIAAVVAAPLLRARGDRGPVKDPRLIDLEVRKEAKYRELHDAESDHAAGKLSAADFERTRAELRTEALEILAQIEQLGGGAPGGVESPPR